MADERPIIRVENLSKRFGDFVVLDDVTFDFPRGKTTAIIGPSGTGKSVLLKHIVGLLAPDQGHVWIDSPTGPVDMSTAGETAKYALRKRLGMLFQDGALFDSLSAGENVAFPLIHHTRLTPEQRRQKALEKLAMVELPHLYDRPTAALSGGQRKRVGLARAIVMEPEVVLFDEPNSGLDPMTSDTIDELIGAMKQRLGITFIVITHDIVSCMNIADYIGMLYKGKLVEYGTVNDFLRSRQQIVRDFLHRNVSLEPVDGELIPRP
jgi:phospholipid/cholesterol/gamma-HCH transport system ATP-binding protein